jgi:KAP family P-loop domain
VLPGPPPPRSVIGQQPESRSQVGTPTVIQTPPPPPDQVGSSAAQGPSETSDVVDVEGAFPKASVGDSASEKDSLGFEPYVQAIAEFLKDPRTEAPLTISVEGEWGAGKSSFMLQLEEALRVRGIESAQFNAWRHDKDESLWAGFALEFSKSVSKRLWIWQRFGAWLRLFCLRLRSFDFGRAFPDLARLVLMLFVYLPLAWFGLVYLVSGGWVNYAETWKLAVDLAHDNKNLETSIIKLGGSAGSVFLLILLLRRLVEVVGNPMAVELRKYGRWPNYEDRLAFIERFHVDLARIAQAYTSADKFCVFIDDLDRCEVPKSADMMQAINLMIPVCKNLIFVIGMDRKRVAAAVAVKHEKLLPYLARRSVTQGPANSTVDPSASKGDSKPAVDSRSGLSYGYTFLEKFIQIPFRLPQANEHSVEALLDNLLGDRTGPEKLSWTGRVVSFWNRFRKRPHVAPGDSSVPLSRGESTAQSGKQTERLRDSLKRSERQIALMVAPALDYNPRRLKQFLNSYRLKAYIASLTDILDISEGAPKEGCLSLPQLGKFVAISLRWPELVSALDDDPGLLSDLQRISNKERRPTPVPAQSGVSPTHQGDKERTDELLRWSGCRLLMELLCKGFDLPFGESRYSLERVNLNKLIQISPRRREPAHGTGA